MTTQRIMVTRIINNQAFTRIDPTALPKCAKIAEKAANVKRPNWISNTPLDDDKRRDYSKMTDAEFDQRVAQSDDDLADMFDDYATYR